MSELRSATILVPLDLSFPETPDRGLLDLLHPVHVVLLGYYPVPDQSAPAQLKDVHEASAMAHLDEVAAAFAEGGSRVSRRLVFTRDRDVTIERIANEFACTAILTTGTEGPINRILVPLRGDATLKQIVALIGELVRASSAEVTFFSASEEEDTGQREFLLRGAADRLSEDGVDRNRIAWKLVEEVEPQEAILEEAAAHDLLVVGETEPTLRERILGAFATQVIDETEKPILIVRSN